MNQDVILLARGLLVLGALVLLLGASIWLPVYLLTRSRRASGKYPAQKGMPRESMMKIVVLLTKSFIVGACVSAAKDCFTHGMMSDAPSWQRALLVLGGGLIATGLFTLLVQSAVRLFEQEGFDVGRCCSLDGQLNVNHIVIGAFATLAASIDPTLALLFAYLAINPRREKATE